MGSTSVVDRGFIGGVMGSMLTSSVVDRGFIGGVMGSMLPITPPMFTIYHTRVWSTLPRVW